jgi:hypothetical protein
VFISTDDGSAQQWWVFTVIGDQVIGIE